MALTMMASHQVKQYTVYGKREEFWESFGNYNVKKSCICSLGNTGSSQGFFIMDLFSTRVHFSYPKIKSFLGSSNIKTLGNIIESTLPSSSSHKSDEIIIFLPSQCISFFVWKTFGSNFCPPVQSLSLLSLTRFLL